MSLSPAFLKRVSELYQSFIKFDASQCERLNRYRNIEPESAQYLAMLIRIQQSQRILEIGTSTGYSTLWLADAAQVTGARIATLEIDAQRTKQAKSFAKELQVDEIIDFHIIDAFDFLKTAVENSPASNLVSYDFILLDAERDAYIQYWPYLINLLDKRNGVLVIDNVISHAMEVKPLIRIIKEDARFITTTLPIGAGLFVVTYKN